MAKKEKIQMSYDTAIKQTHLKKERVHHPEHYNKGIEVITFIESWDLNFSRGSAVKYICRGGIKDIDKEIEDLEKAKQYIQFEINRIRREAK